MTPLRPLTSYFGHRPLGLLPSFALAPYANTKGTDSGVVPNTERRIAVIPVVGMLVHGPSVPELGMQSYTDVTRAFLAALENDRVDAVALLFDSPGGEVAGCFDAADFIFANRGTKPVTAILDDGAYSAAYALASACDSITIPRTGGCGSVGVVAIHMEMSRALDQAGVTPTVIRSPAGKAQQSEMEPLPAGERARIQAENDKLADMFAGIVARNRRMTVAAVKATNAATFMGEDAVKVGFADKVASPDVAFLSLAYPREFGAVMARNPKNRSVRA